MNLIKRCALLSVCLAAFSAVHAHAQDVNIYAKYRSQVDEAPFIVISKEDLKLVLLDDKCNVLMESGISCAKNVGPKKVKGDHKTPEGKFKINQLLYSKHLSHDFHDGKGSIAGAYGPWFLRLDVPGFIDIGIHGTHKPESIGTRDTEGCIRLVNEEIVRLKSQVKVGTPVIILPEGERFQ